MILNSNSQKSSNKNDLKHIFYGNNKRVKLKQKKNTAHISTFSNKLKRYRKQPYKL